MNPTLITSIYSSSLYSSHGALPSDASFTSWVRMLERSDMAALYRREEYESTHEVKDKVKPDAT